jgi:PII-like signaling protein
MGTMGKAKGGWGRRGEVGKNDVECVRVRVPVILMAVGKMGKINSLNSIYVYVCV